MQIKATLTPRHINERNYTNKKGEQASMYDILFDDGESMLSITAFKNDDVTLVKSNIGVELSVEFSLVSKEYNGKYYTNMTLTTISALATTQIPADAKFDIPSQELPF